MKRRGFLATIAAALSGGLALRAGLAPAAPVAVVSGFPAVVGGELVDRVTVYESGPHWGASLGADELLDRIWNIP